MTYPWTEQHIQVYADHSSSTWYVLVTEAGVNHSRIVIGAPAAATVRQWLDIVRCVLTSEQAKHWSLHRFHVNLCHKIFTAVVKSVQELHCICQYIKDFDIFFKKISISHFSPTVTNLWLMSAKLGTSFHVHRSKSTLDMINIRLVGWLVG